MFFRKKDWVLAMSKVRVSPKNSRDKTVPVAAEISRGSRAALVRSSISTSMAKTMAMIGALKMAATAAVEPQASSKVVDLALRLKSCARLEPMAEPVSTIGASSPTEPPKPTVNVLATIDEYMLCLRSFPSLLKMDFSTMDTPCPI